MHFAPRSHLRPQAAAGHDVVDGELQTRRKFISLAEPLFHPGKPVFESIDDFPYVGRCQFDLRYAACEAAKLRGNED